MPEIPALPELPDPASALSSIPPQPASIGVSPGTAASGAERAVPPLYPSAPATAPASAPGGYR